MQPYVLGKRKKTLSCTQQTELQDKKQMDICEEIPLSLHRFITHPSLR